MFERQFKYTIPAMALVITLPKFTHKTADISVQSDGEGVPVGMRHDSNNPEILNVSPFWTARKVIVTVTQEYPFDKVAPIKNRVVNVGQTYEAGELVEHAGGLYRLGQYYTPMPSPIPVGQFNSLSYKVGEIKFTVFDNLGEGWWPCNGTTINSPGSFMHGKIAPDLRDKSIVGGGGSYNVGTQVGSNVATVTKAHLPVDTFDVSVVDAGNLGGTTGDIPFPYDAIGNPDSPTDTNGVYPRAYWRGKAMSGVGVNVSPHGHRASVKLNSSQLSLDNRQAGVVLNAFIRL